MRFRFQVPGLQPEGLVLNTHKASFLNSEVVLKLDRSGDGFLNYTSKCSGCVIRFYIQF